jgi:hypothetical protein
VHDNCKCETVYIVAAKRKSQSWFTWLQLPRKSAILEKVIVLQLSNVTLHTHFTLADVACFKWFS